LDQHLFCSPQLQVLAFLLLFFRLLFQHPLFISKTYFPSLIVALHLGLLQLTDSHLNHLDFNSILNSMIHFPSSLYFLNFHN
jgi:hypothetical protein